MPPVRLAVHAEFRKSLIQASIVYGLWTSTFKQPTVYPRFGARRHLGFRASISILTKSMKGPND
ncbi:MAG TPA: hypothetical protein VG297_25550 [Bryobacteraceae bacterium]|nr:hypothetical protein [Bryobacteraceae bacterium]